MPNTVDLIDMKAKSDFYKNNIKSENSFFQAVYNGDLAAVKAHIEADKSLFQAVTSKGDTALMVAVLGKRQAMVEFLIKENPGLKGDCTPRFENPQDGTTALEIAAALGDTTTLTALFKAQYGKNEKSYSDSRATTEAKYAIVNSHSKIVDIYSQNIPYSMIKDTKLIQILLLIIELNNAELFAKMITDKCRRGVLYLKILITCLFKALELDRDNITGFLIDQIKKYPDKELDPLLDAAENGDVAIFKKLVATQVYDLLQLTSNGRSCLSIASHYGRSQLVAYMIEQAKHEPNFKAILQFTHPLWGNALTQAIHSQVEGPFDLLLSSGKFDVTLPHRSGLNIVELALEQFLEVGNPHAWNCILKHAKTNLVLKTMVAEATRELDPAQRKKALGDLELEEMAVSEPATTYTQKRRRV